MDELISRIASNVGIDETIARKAVEIILGFLNKEGDDNVVSQIIGAIPGAQDILQSGSEDNSGGGLMGMIAGATGMGGGIMGAANALMGAGLGMGEVQSVTKEVIAFSREKAGDDAVDSLIASIPGLSQFA